MSNFVNNHTFCYACGSNVYPGKEHTCRFTSFTPTNIYFCTHCQSFADIICKSNYTLCSNCGFALHGWNASETHTVMHRIVPPKKK